MRKFLINKVLIEKTQKDINTNIPYEFGCNFNLICGQNEAGKSSLTTFLKNSFLLARGEDSGKIFLNLITDNKSDLYRADINLTKKAVADRCKLIDGNDVAANYSILNEVLDKKYFEQGFCINLDDLNNLKYDNSQDLDNVIKDPSANKLNDFLGDTKKNITNVLGERNAVIGDTKKTLEKINELEKQISELSNKENEYNSILKQIELTNKNLDENYTLERILENEKDLLKAKNTLKELQINLETKLSQLNQLFIDNESKYFDLITNIGLYNQNTTLINENNEKFNTISQNLTDELSSLSSNFGVNLSQQEIINLTFDDKLIKTIKDILNAIKEEEFQITQINNSKEEKLKSTFKLNNEIKDIKLFERPISDFTKLKNINASIKNNLEDSALINERLSEENATNSNKVAIWPYITIITLSIISFVIFYLQKNYEPSYYFLGIAFFATIASIVYKSRTPQTKCELNEFKKDKKNIINELKMQLKEIYPEVENLRDNLFFSKIETIQQKIETAINSFEEKFKELSILNNEIENFENNLTVHSKKLSELNIQIAELKKNFKDLANDEYLEFIEKIKTIKEIIYKKIEAENLTEKLNKKNNSITNELKNFILSNNINISIGENLSDTIENLKKYQEFNNNLKDEIKLLKTDINKENQNIAKIEDIKNGLMQNLSKEIEIKNIDLELQEIQKIQNNLKNLKEELQKNKYDLEKVQGIIKLKEERNALLNEYRNTIKNLLINKMVVTLTDKAKSTFDKTLPDLVNAQKYLSILTDNKYCEINLDLKEISGENSVNIKKWDNLSRGTKEQLYLSLRLGYASNYTIDKTTGKENNNYALPLIIDDAFVNFDHIRTKNAIKSLIEFSKNNQVLFFTCHEEEIKNILTEISDQNITNIIQI